MGLDAIVSCDCFERGRLRTPPLPEWDVYVDYTGSRCERTLNFDESMAFLHWNRTACDHEDGVLLHHYLGNISLIGFLRQVLGPRAAELPIITTKVIYSGSHCGDILEIDEVERLRAELSALPSVHASNSKDEQFIRDFEQQLRELTDAALRLGKPIAF